jgi:hypothetical protein
MLCPPHTICVSDSSKIHRDLGLTRLLEGVNDCLNQQIS